MPLSTTQCCIHDHPEFTLEFDEDLIPANFAEGLIATIELMVQAGSRFELGQSFQVGWMQTRVAPKGDSLTLDEPRMDRTPWEFVRGVTQTLRHQMVQMFTSDSFGISRDQIEIPNARMSALACTRFPDSSGLVGFRNERESDIDTGWFFGCGEDDHDHNQLESLVNMSLFEAFLSRPEILNFLWLPVGTAMDLTRGERPAVFLDDEELTITPGSFLDEACRKLGL
jgi:hypothetical protein